MMPGPPEPPTGAPTRYFFCHLQKTAGTSLIVRLQRHFGETAVYPNISDGEPVDRVIAIPHLLARWKARGHQIRLVTGHFPLCTTELLGGKFTTFTVLREPVERTLSQLRHRRRTLRLDRQVPLETLYANHLQFHGLIHNHMVKMLALTTEEMTHGALTRTPFTQVHLERAKARLREVNVVGVCAQFEQFCDRLQTELGLNLGASVRVNRTEPEDVPEAFRRRIADDNALDVELYDAACAMTGVAGERR